jgi:hypothetical protein
MSIQPRRPLLDSLKDVLHKMESDPAPSPNLADLQRILRERIEEIEAAQRIAGNRATAVRELGSLSYNQMAISSRGGGWEARQSDAENGKRLP